MKLNKRIRLLLKQLNHWHCVKAFEKQRVLADNITIFKTMYGYRHNQPGVFAVSYRCYDSRHKEDSFHQQYWIGRFAIRDSMGNPTRIGKMMGIGTRDRRISVYSPKGQAIEQFLHRIAWIDACRMTNNRSEIKDNR